MTSPTEKPECPVGESSCEWLDEVVDLRRKIDELSELVATDALTGLFNFRHFKTVLQAAAVYRPASCSSTWIISRR